MKFIAYTQKGIEDICANEIKRILDAKVLEIHDKIIVFEFDCKDLSDLRKLTTIDDIGFFVFSTNDLKNNQQDIDIIANQIIDSSIGEFIELISETRSIDINKFSLTVNSSAYFLTSTEIKYKLAHIISKEINSKYIENDHSNFDIRINISKNYCLIGIKVFEKSLFQRKYKILTDSGALRSTIATSMIEIAVSNYNGQERPIIVDNFCGTGTILCEAVVKGFDICGGDIDIKKVNIAKKNMSQINPKLNNGIKLLDATRTNYNSKSFDIAVSNLPWDNKIKTENISKLYELAFKEYRRILKDNYSFCFLCMKPELAIKKIKGAFGDIDLNSKQIGYLGNRPTLIYKKSHR